MTSATVQASSPLDRFVTPALLDGTIVIYCVPYFLSNYGRPNRWVPEPTR